MKIDYDIFEAAQVFYFHRKIIQIDLVTMKNVFFEMKQMEMIVLTA